MEKDKTSNGNIGVFNLGKITKRPHIAICFIPDLNKPIYQKSKDWFEKELRRTGYQLEMETPNHRDWLIAVTNNPDIDKAKEVFLKIAKIWAKEIGIPDFAISDYQKYKYGDKLRKKG